MVSETSCPTELTVGLLLLFYSVTPLLSLTDVSLRQAGSRYPSVFIHVIFAVCPLAGGEDNISHPKLQPCWKKYSLSLSENWELSFYLISPCSAHPAIQLLIPSSSGHSLFTSTLHGHLSEDCSSAHFNKTEIHALTIAAKKQLRIEKTKNTTSQRLQKYKWFKAWLGFHTSLSVLLGHLVLLRNLCWLQLLGKVKQQQQKN